MNWPIFFLTVWALGPPVFTAWYIWVVVSEANSQEDDHVEHGDDDDDFYIM